MSKNITRVNLIIDQGNTMTKMALFEREEPREIFYFDHWSISEIKQLQEKYTIEKCIFSSVAVVSATEVDYLRTTIKNFLFFDHTTSLPLTVNYLSPHTLGLDRLAACVGAWEATKGKHPLLVIDAGTAITYDLVLPPNIFQGGNISPGMMMRFRALNQFTGRLPLISPDGEYLSLGNDTQTAIRSGVISGIMYEMEGYIDDLKTKYPHLLIFLTGGDSKQFAAKLKSTIFVDTNLVLKGLNRILVHNVEE